MSQIETILKSTSVGEVGGEAVLTTPAVGLEAALRQLAASHRGALLVVDERGSLVGIFTERDVLTRIVGRDLDPDTKIFSVMTVGPMTIAADRTLADALALMTKRGIRQLPVLVAGERAPRMITSRDILEFVASHYRDEVLNLPPRLHQRLRSEGP